MEEDEKNPGKSKLPKKIPPPKEFQVAKLHPEKFFPVNEDEDEENWIEVTSFTAGVKDWYTANQKKK